jgi:signal peptide peptidase SppA
MSNNLMRVARALHCEPWLIRPDMHAVLREIVADHIAGGAREMARRSAGEAFAQAEPAAADKPPYDVVDGVAVVPLQGVLGQRLGMMEKSSGATDVVDFIGTMDKVAGDDNVRAVVLNVDSPGGSVGGIAEAADAVARVRASGKYVFAYTDSMMASAAYWIGAAADVIYVGAFASVGSVGVYLAMLDQSAAYSAAGLKVDLIKSGEYKGMGTPGTSLTPEQRAHLQERVDTIGAAFRGYVQAQRKKISASSLDGRDFMGRKAVELGFADYVGTLEQAIRDVRVLADKM